MKTREEKIEALVADISNWDLGTLIGYAKHVMRAALESSTDEEVDSDYLEACVGDVEET